MGWVYRDADQHKCAKPGYDGKVVVGDIWQCDTCKKKYKVTNVVKGQFDQRDGWYGGNITWKEVVIPYTDWRD